MTERNIGQHDAKGCRTVSFFSHRRRLPRPDEPAPGQIYRVEFSLPVQAATVRCDAAHYDPTVLGTVAALNRDALGSGVSCIGMP